MLGTRSQDRVQESQHPDPTHEVILQNSMQKKATIARRRRGIRAPSLSPIARLIPDSSPPSPPLPPLPRSVARDPRQGIRRPPSIRGNSWRSSHFQHKGQSHGPRRPGTLHSRPAPKCSHRTRNKTVKILQLNVSGMRRRAAEASLLCAKRDIAVACLQESHLKHGDLSPRIQGFTAVARQDREDGYGGAITYIRDDLRGKLLSRDCFNTGRVQLCTVVLRTSRGILPISNVYAAPGWLRTDRSWLDAIPPHAVLLGDVNAVGTWDLVNIHNVSRAEDQLLEEKLLELGFEILNDGSPTRSSTNEAVASSAIDITAAQPQWARLCTWQVDDEPTTDHHTIITTIHLHCTNAVPRRRRWAFHHADWEKFRSVLDDYLRTHNAADGSLENQNRVLVRAILYAARRSVPKGRRPKEVPWWNAEVEGSIRKRKEAWKVFLSGKTPEAKDALRKQQEETDRTISQAKRGAWKDTVARLSATDGNTLLWKVLKGMDRRGKPFTPKTLRGCERSSDRTKANCFLRRFVAATKKQGKETRHRNAYRRQMDKAKALLTHGNLDTFLMTELNAVIHSMHVKRTGGPDDVQVCFLKELSTTAKDMLLRLYNRSYREGITTASWRMAEMLPIEKPGKQYEFRPISLTNVIARCMERLLLTRLQPWIESILPPQQAGFRKYRSCEEQIAGLTEDIGQAIYSKKIGVALFLDYSGAYDRVSIKALLAKIGTRHCPPQILLLLRSFLTDRRAYCRWGDSKSRVRLLPNGLPQGSSLSCLLWDAYILDLPEKINEGRISLFADDTSAWVIGNTFRECITAIKEMLTKIVQYCTELWIKINPAKTVLMPFGNKRWDLDELTIDVCGQQVRPVSSGRFLGVIIDSKLNFQMHSQQVAERLLRRCRLLASLSARSWGADERILQLTRKALLEPIAKYACAAWVPHASDSALLNVERARNVALRLQTGCCKPTSVERLRELTATDSLREEATKAAAVLLEKNARVAQPLTLLDNAGMRKKCRLGRSSAKEAGETRLAKLGLLPLKRLPFPQPTLRDPGAIPLSQVQFFYADCSRSDDEELDSRKPRTYSTVLQSVMSKYGRMAQ